MQQFPQLLFWSSADSTMLLSPSYLQQQAALADSFTRACCAPGLCWCRDVIWFRCLLAHTPALFPLNLASLPVARQNGIQTWSILNCVCVLHHLCGEISFTTSPSTTCQGFFPQVLYYLWLAVVIFSWKANQLLLRIFFVLAHSFREGILHVSPWKLLGCF